MYHYVPSKPVVINLNNDEGFHLRVKAAEFVEEILARGKEAGSPTEQSYGVLAEMVIRKQLGFPDKSIDDPLGYDIVLPSKVRVDIKCRGGVFPFKEYYEGAGKIPREAKHNLWARQLYNNEIESDIYLLAHLQTPKETGGKSPLPGTRRQMSWYLFVCGWVSTLRAKNEGVYLPRGAITEQGQKWFPYRGEEVEFYHIHLNGLSTLRDLLKLDHNDLVTDAKKVQNMHLTSIDALRITLDLVGRGILPKETVQILKEELDVTEETPPFFHPNQYFHLMKWLISKNMAKSEDLAKLKKTMEEKKFEGIY